MTKNKKRPLQPDHGSDDASYDASDDPGGDIDDPGGGSSNDGGLFSSFTTSASTLSKTPASYVSSSLTTRVSLLKSTADVVKYTDVDCATGSFCCQMSQVTRGANCPIRSFPPITWLLSDWHSHWRSRWVLGALSLSLCPLS